MKLIHFMDALKNLSFENAFNPYSNRCAIHDMDDAPERRLELLHTLLEVAIAQEIDSMWIGRDLGHRGGRRTGLAFTDDLHIPEHGARWGLSIQRPTKGEIAVERTAAVIWSVLARVKESVFLWNVFPLHPHEPGKPFSNRSHNTVEREKGERLLSDLILLLEPNRLFAIGNDAARSVRRLCDDDEVFQVRHPSYGGKSQFIAQMCKAYNLDSGHFNVAP